jgi:hypothetical protein
MENLPPGRNKNGEAISPSTSVGSAPPRHHRPGPPAPAPAWRPWRAPAARTSRPPTAHPGLGRDHSAFSDAHRVGGKRVPPTRTRDSRLVCLRAETVAITHARRGEQSGRANHCCVTSGSTIGYVGVASGRLRARMTPGHEIRREFSVSREASHFGDEVLQPSSEVVLDPQPRQLFQFPSVHVVSILSKWMRRSERPPGVGTANTCQPLRVLAQTASPAEPTPASSGLRRTPVAAARVAEAVGGREQLGAGGLGRS